MKWTLILLILFSAFSSCKKEESATSIDSNFMPSASDRLISEASFSSEVHPTSGRVKLFKNNSTYTLQFLSLQSDNGPDLRVYLSPNKLASTFLDLGRLKATSGNFEYTFDLTTDVTDNNHVLIWCEDFGILFGSAVF